MNVRTRSGITEIVAVKPSKVLDVNNYATLQIKKSNTTTGIPVLLLHSYSYTGALSEATSVENTIMSFSYLEKNSNSTINV